MNAPNPFAELAKLAGSGRKAARILGIHKSRYNRLALGRVRVSFAEMAQATEAIAAFSRSQTRTSEPTA